MKGDLEVKVVARVKGMWKLAFLTFLFRHKSAKHTVHVHISDGHGTRCLTHPTSAAAEHLPRRPPSLTGQA